MKISDLMNSSNFKLLQVGEPGSGKSFRALSAIRFGRVLVIDTDQKFAGLVSRLQQYYGKAEIDSKVEVEIPRSAAEYKTIMLKLPSIAASFQTIVLDTMSRSFDMVLNDIKAANPKGDGRQIFGACLERNLENLNMLLGLPQNIIINSHVGAEDMADGTSKLTSTTPGKFGKKLPEFFNEVHYLYIDGNNKPKARGEPSSLVVARTVRDKALLDSFGIFKVNDLSIFDDQAFKAK